MNEIAGNAALLVDPYSEEDIIMAMRKILDKNVKASILKNIKRRKILFSRNIMGKKMIDIYKECNKNG